MKKHNNNKENKAKEKNKKINLNIIFMFIFSITFIFSAYQIITWFIDMQKAEEQHQELLNKVVSINSNEGDNVNELGGNSEDNGNNIAEINIDFEKLLEINKDVKGWIIIDGTNINYPILQSGNNDYYLKRDINKNIVKSGSIYLDYRNNGFSDKNTLLYGHNMKNGTMFSQLERIYNNELGNDIKINIYTPEGNKVYKVFSTYTIKPENFNMDMDINEILEKSKMDFDGEVNDESGILTLFTCTDSMSERIIVHGILI